ncbi:formate dehydrogenase-O, major subunit [Escherichia coli]|uniref:Formate dehydrogenase-O, major subunit n=1 Tax=Escherichia coli TaxID=562 RepID=A0A485JLS3_ECOLX|nr:formate dehydrogenase-O, major subunit [Escherichia coli]
MTLPSEKQTDLQTYLTANTPKTAAGRPGKLLGQLPEILRLYDEGLLW